MASLAAIGLMSGTSRDGMDAAYIETDGLLQLYCGRALTVAYTPAFQQALGALCAAGEEASERDQRNLGDQLSDHALSAIDRVMAAESPSVPISVVGFPGHTLWHKPDEGRTLQIGDGARLARRSRIDVVSDFRSADMRAGGQGAPLAPLYHRALSRHVRSRIPDEGGKPLVFLNLGGVANATWIGEEDEPLCAFDTGVGNALLDDWMLRHSAGRYDKDGRAASKGRVSRRVLEALLETPWFDLPPPKSLDRDSFSLHPLAGLSREDGAATLCAFTAEAVRLASRFFPAPPALYVVCGGGRNNPALCSALQLALPCPLRPVDAFGFDGDALEAQAFAYLAVRVKAGLPTSLPETTGAERPICGGTIHGGCGGTNW